MRVWLLLAAAALPAAAGAAPAAGAALAATPTVAALGLAVGVVLALTGAGGGILAVPALVFGAGLGMADAGPIGLLAVGLAASLGALLGLKAGIVRYKAALLIAGAGIVCSPLGLWLARRAPNRPLSFIFALVLLYVAWRAWRRAHPHVAAAADAAAASAHATRDAARATPPCRFDAGRGKLVWTAPCARALAVSGLIAGGLSGLLGVGGGFVMIPALQRYTDLAVQSVVATSLAVIALVSLSGVAASAANGHLQWGVALPFSAGAMAGMLAGRVVAGKLAGPLLQQAFALLSAAVAAALLAKSVL